MSKFMKGLILKDGFFRVKFISIAILCLVVLPQGGYAENLPEFFGCYIQSQDGSFTEMSQNNSVGSTGWFVKQKKTSSGDALKDFQAQLEGGGDLGAALRAGSNIKKFLTGFSGLNVTPSELKGFVLYGEFNINNVKLYKLSNNIIPENATFVEYHGPKPIDRNKMWMPSDSIEFRSKPIKDKMYFVKPRELLECGCYMFSTGEVFFDFKISSNENDPFIGKYTWTTYSKETGLFGKTYVNSESELHITSVSDDGSVEGFTLSKDRKTGEIEKESVTDTQIDRKNKKFISKGEDEGKEGNLYGITEGDISIDSPSECECMKVKIKTKFIPYEKYKDHEYLRKHKIYGEIIKD